MVDAAPALTVFDDPRAKARELARLHEQWQQTGAVPGAKLRDVVARAWNRPEVRAAQARPVLSGAQIADRREAAYEMAAVRPLLQERLLQLADAAGSELVLCDANGIVLWVAGPRQVRRASEGLGFVEGACWAEESVGSNALGTALVERAPVQLFGAEHSNPGHHGWVCSAVPIRSPRSDRPLGALTLSGPLVSAHPHTLGFIAAVVDEAQRMLADQHASTLAGLAADAAAVSGPHVIVDEFGWVSSSLGYAVSGRLPAPADLREGPGRWVDGIGCMDVIRCRGGFVLRPAAAEPTGVEIISGARPSVQICSPQGATSLRLTARQHQLLSLIAGHPAGLGASQLAALAYDDPTALVTVRAELSRLRRKLGPIIASRPYRLTVAATFRNPVV